MKKQILLFFIAVLQFGFQHRRVDHRVEIDSNYNSSELLLRWFDNLRDRELIDSIYNEPGSQIMADNVRLLSDSSYAPIKSFRDELNLFSPADTTNKLIYGTDLAFKMRKESSLLLQKLRSQQIKDTIIRRALVYIPNDYVINTKCNIYFVLTGWEWGDAYVCNIRQQNGRFYISEEGEPSVIINLSLISKLYGKTAEEQIKVLNGIMSHEIFHFLFASYKKQSPVYNASRDTSIIGKLLDVIQNEGVAHYVDKKPLLMQEYEKGQKYADLEKENINKLNEAFLQLSGNNLNETQKRELLRKASTGKYWSKFGSISGMFMAYHIEKEKGLAALRESIQKGAVYFIKQYLSLRKTKTTLPDLNNEFKYFINH